MKLNYLLSGRAINSARVLKTAFFLLVFITAKFSAQTAGTVSSNSDKICVGQSEKFWTNGWSGGVWSSSKPNVLKVDVNGNEAYATGISQGSADVVYTLTHNSQTYISKKTITVIAAPGTIGGISGSAIQCGPVTGQVYSIEPVSNATKYVWTVPNDWTITSGGNTNTITVNVGNSSGNVEVYAATECRQTETKYFYVNVYGKVSAPVAYAPDNIQCTEAGLKWQTQSSAKGYYVDIARDVAFTRFVSGYENRYVDPNHWANNLPTGNLYFRIRAVDNCGNISANSNVITFKTKGPYTGIMSPNQVLACGAEASDIKVTNHDTSNAIITKWQRSTHADFSLNVIDINETSSTLQASKLGPIISDTYVRAEIKNSSDPWCTVYTDVVKVSRAQLSAPTVAVTNPTCAIAGSAKITNYSSDFTYHFIPTGPRVDANGNILDLSFGTSYKITAKNLSGCSSPLSNSFNINDALPLPAAPQIEVSAPSCTTSGSAKILNYIATNSYTFSPAGPRVKTGGVIENLEVGVSYTVFTTAFCSSVPSAAFVIAGPTPNISATVSISTDKSIICQGTKVTFTASPVNGGSAPAYQWFVNGVAVAGQTAATFETKELKNGDKVSVKLTPSPQQCVSPEPVVSNVLTMSEETSVYENGKWSKGIPTAENQLSAEIRQTYSTADGAVSACSVHLVGDAIVTVVPKNPLTVYNNINLDNGTKLTVESDANLIQVNDSAPANTGNITVLRKFKIKPKSAEYNYFGSPVTFAAGQSMKTIYQGITYVLYHNEANNYFYNSSGANVPGRGLAVKEPSVDTPNGAYDITATFIGVPQNGIINFALANSNTATSSHLGYNLVGNPYPSNIDLQALYELNKGQIAADPAISTSFYFWDSTANNVYVQQGSSYGGQAYGVFNAKSGSTGMGIPAAGPKEGLTARKIPKSEITVGQGFMVKALKKNATLQFNNSIRTDKNSGVKFIGARGEEVVDDRYWLSVTTPRNLTSTLAVVYFDAGTDALGAEDSEARGGSDEVFSLVSGKNIAINGKSTFADTDVVEIGTRHFAAGLHTIALEKAEGIFASGQQIYLKDKITGAVTNLSQGNYTFEAQAGESTGRFELVYKPGGVLATDASAKEEVQVYRAADNFVVKAPKRITSLEIYDMSGRLVRAFKPNTPEAVVNGSELANGVYLMNIKQGQEQTVKKIVK